MSFDGGVCHLVALAVRASGGMAEVITAFRVALLRATAQAACSEFTVSVHREGCRCSRREISR